MTAQTALAESRSPASELPTKPVELCSLEVLLTALDLWHTSPSAVLKT
jgi:hypothetical protein